MLPPITIKYSKEEIEFGPHAHIQDSVKELFPIHRHEFYEIFLVIEGKAIHMVNGQMQIIERGSLVFIRPSDVHYFEQFNDKELVFLNVGLPEMDIIPALEYMNIPLSRIVDPPLPIHLSVLGATFSLLAEKLTRLAQIFPSKMCRPLLRSFLCEIYAPLILQDDTQRCADTIPAWMNELITAMSNSRHYIQGTDWIYANCPYSREHIIRSFQRYLHMTPTEYVNEKRMTYACELLREKRFSITEICFMVGFNNLSHFYHVFKDKYHCTPREYLNRAV